MASVLGSPLPHSEIGSHILSGNVLDPKGIHDLFPDLAANEEWRNEMEAATGSHATSVTSDTFLLMPNDSSSYHLPNMFLPPQLHNSGNFVVSLSQICRWLATKAEELGVEIYPGFAASEVIVEDGAVRGIVTRDVGIGKDGEEKSTFEPGVELRARQTFFAEGARGSCTEWLIKHYDLRMGGSINPQVYGLGIKEVWQIPKEKHQSGYVQHTLGYPLQQGLFDKNFGGSFMYHQDPDLVLVGFVVGLDYENPYLNPYKEFQRWKTHPDVKHHLEGGTCVAYGARVINEGGYHSVPKTTFPGGALLGCSAGYLNAVKIKGSHMAMKSGILAADAAHAALTSASVEPVSETFEIDPSEKPQELTGYPAAVEKSWIHDELYSIRNTHAAFAKWGTLPGVVYTGLSTFITQGREPWTLDHKIPDSARTGKKTEHKPIDYPAPDGELTFDLLSNLQRSGVYHEDDQPAHLRIKPECAQVPESVSMQQFAAPESRFCPAGVYEYVATEDDPSKEKLVINAQNCIHCKCCSIKMPDEYIEWTVPEGGGGPQYQVM